MVRNPLHASCVRILESMARCIEGDLRTENSGLGCANNGQFVRWVQMDNHTSAVICSIKSENISGFVIEGPSGIRFFNALMVERGNLNFCDNLNDGTIGLLSGELLYFRNVWKSVSLEPGNEGICNFILISYSSTAGREFPGLSDSKGHIKLLQGSVQVQNSLSEVFALAGSDNRYFELKGLLFSIIGASLPNQYRKMFARRQRQGLGSGRKIKIASRPKMRENKGHGMAGI